MGLVLAGCVAVGSAGLLLAGPGTPTTLTASVLTPPSPQPSPGRQPGPTPQPSTSAAPRSPSPSPAPTPQRSPKPDGGGHGWFDVSGVVVKAVNAWFTRVLNATAGPVLRWLGTTLLHTPDVTTMPRVASMWSGSAVVANSCYVLLIIVGGITVMTGESLQAAYTVKQVAPRLVLGALAANSSQVVISKAITFANAVAEGLLGQQINNASLFATLSHIVTSGGGLLNALLGLVVVVLGVVVLVVFIVRLMAVVLLAAAAPLCLACHGLPQTDRVAVWWWRAFTGCLVIQIAQALVLITAVRVWFTDPVGDGMIHGSGSQDVLDVLVVICLLYVCARIPTWVFKLAMRGGTGGPVVRTLKTVASMVIFRKVLGKLRTRPGTRSAVRSVARPSPVRSATRGGDGAITPAGIGRSAPKARWRHDRKTPPGGAPVHGRDGSATPEDVLTHAPRVSWAPKQRRYPSQGTPGPKGPSGQPMPPQPWPYGTRPPGAAPRTPPRGSGSAPGRPSVRPKKPAAGNGTPPPRTRQPPAEARKPRPPRTPPGAGPSAKPPTTPPPPPSSKPRRRPPGSPSGPSLN